jgi:hypothetical protein
MGYKIVGTDGAVKARLDPSVIMPTSLGKLSRMIGVPMATAEPGDYQLVISLKDELSGQAVELNEPFSLVAQVAENRPTTP